MSYKPFPDKEAVIAARVDSGHSGGPVLELSGRVRGLILGASEDPAGSQRCSCHVHLWWTCCIISRFHVQPWSFLHLCQISHSVECHHRLATCPFIRRIVQVCHRDA